ncbi:MULTISPECIES: HAD-IA family hydrolase [Streptomyces]|uniref:HAD-IA family hydrolase n=1 Tax=Streptomyces eurythermus TaxID=42237 RepID=A0ABW6Z9M0_9ACTN|nr:MULTISPECIES: HAD-IA family hydrolase [Streptomyces]QIS75113.1 HAD-IA family hydrolase [Streptomyces sp. DSM 40868]
MPDTDPRPVLLIDMGGVFFTYSFQQAIEHWAKAAGTQAQALHEAWQIDAPFDRFERGEIEPAAYLAHLRRLLHLELDDAQLTEGWNAIYGPVNTDLVRLLRTPDVRDRFTAVVAVSNTNALHAPAWRRLYERDLDVFDTVVCSHEIGTTKPLPSFFDHICAAHHVPRERLVLVDDIPKVTRAASALGLTTHTYTDNTFLQSFLKSL